jgi:hypothetical protein
MPGLKYPQPPKAAAGRIQADLMRDDALNAEDQLVSSAQRLGMLRFN